MYKNLCEIALQSNPLYGHQLKRDTSLLWRVFFLLEESSFLFNGYVHTIPDKTHKTILDRASVHT